MHTKRKRNLRKMNTRKHIGGKKMNKSNKAKGITGAISAAEQKFKRTGSIQAARSEFRKAALTNARKLFGSIGQF